MGTTKRGGNNIEKSKVAISPLTSKSTLVNTFGSFNESQSTIPLTKSWTLDLIEPYSEVAAVSTCSRSYGAGENPWARMDPNSLLTTAIIAEWMKALVGIM